MSRSARTDDDTEVFSGLTVDDALRAARTAYGPQVQVVRAMRVLAGVRGLLGQARYSVVVRRPPVTSVTVLRLPDAAPPAAPAAPPSGDAVSSALEDLLDAAEARERGPVEPADDAGWSFGQQDEIAGLLAELGDRLTGAAPHPAPDLAAHPEAAPWPGTRTRRTPGRRWLPEADELQAPPADDDRTVDGETVPPTLSLDEVADAAYAAVPLPDAEPGTAPDLGPGWDRDELRRLGVPTAVLCRLPVEDPSDDAGWRRALVTAIASTVPPPAPPDALHPVVLSGHGLLGAIAVMRAALEDGVTPGTISWEGRTRPATPAALVDVLALRARS